MGVWAWIKALREGSPEPALPAQADTVAELCDVLRSIIRLLEEDDETHWRAWMMSSLTKLEANHNSLTDLPEAMAALTKLKSLYVQSNKLIGLSRLHERVLRHLPLLNLGLGCNKLDLSEAIEMPSVRLGLAWNAGTPPIPLQGVLTDRFATVDHSFEPACNGHRGDVLLVAFAAQGAGMQQWAAPCSATRAAGVALDALYLADPSNSYYLQDPSCEYDGVRHYEQLIIAHTQHYKHVLMVGSSMGGTAALIHAHLAHRGSVLGRRPTWGTATGPTCPTEQSERAPTPSAARSSVQALLRRRPSLCM